MEVCMCDACKKILPAKKMKHISDWWDRRRLDLCDDCYEKLDIIIKEFDERASTEREKIKNDYIKKTAEMGIEHDDRWI